MSRADRLREEALQLKQKLVSWGYPPGTPIRSDTPQKVKITTGKLWSIGYELNRLSGR